MYPPLPPQNSLISQLGITAKPGISGYKAVGFVEEDSTTQSIQAQNDIHSLMMYLERLRQASFDEISTVNSSNIGDIFQDSETIDFTFTSTGPIVTAILKALSITSAFIASNTITFDKLFQVTGQVLVGKSSGTGNIELITIGSGLTMTGTVLSASSTTESFDTILIDANGDVITSDGSVLVQT